MFLSLRYARSVQPIAPDAYNVKLEPTTYRSVCLMSNDGSFAMFLQRDVRLDKGKLTVIDVTSADVFVLIIDVPWSVASEQAGSSLDVRMVGVPLQITFYSFISSANKYLFRIIMDELALSAFGGGFQHGFTSAIVTPKPDIILTSRTRLR